MCPIAEPSFDLVVVESDLGAPRAGTGTGPAAVLEACGLAREPGLRGLHRIRAPKLPQGVPPTDLDVRAAVLRPLLVEVRDAVGASLARGNLTVVLHGDDSTVVGIAAGIACAGRAMGLVYLDAHGDANTRETTPSCCLFGMGVAHLLGRGVDDLLSLFPAGAEGRTRFWCGRDVVLAGTRALDPGEGEFLREQGVRVLSPAHVESQAVDGLAEELRQAAGPDLWIHVDVDVVDPAEASASLCTVPGGIHAATLHGLIAALVRCQAVRVLSLGNYLPEADGNGRTLAVVRGILRCLGLGER